jgi:hypothetical protein
LQVLRGERLGDGQANLFREQEKTGKPLAAVNRARAEQRADELADRREQRIYALDLAGQISATPPVVVGGQYILAIVQVDGGQAQEPRYVRQSFGKEPDFGATSVSYELGKLLARSTAPS